MISSLEILIKKLSFIWRIGWKKTIMNSSSETEYSKLSKKGRRILTQLNNQTQNSRKRQALFFNWSSRLTTWKLSIWNKLKNQYICHFHQNTVGSIFPRNGIVFDAFGQSNSCLTVSTGSIPSAYTPTENCALLKFDLIELFSSLMVASDFYCRNLEKNAFRLGSSRSSNKSFSAS